jgi:hypothetical protein
MGRLLDRVDRAVDANAILFQRCLESVSSLVRVAPQFYGPEQDPSASDGVMHAAVAMFQAVRQSVGDLPEEELVGEYTAELEQQTRLAREQRADVLVTDVAVGGNKES